MGEDLLQLVRVNSTNKYQITQCKFLNNRKIITHLVFFLKVHLHIAKLILLHSNKQPQYAKQSIIHPS